MPKEAKKPKRRLLNLRIDEVSIVDHPAIDEQFLLIKRQQPEQKAESAMGLKIRAALEAKGMTLEQLAEAAKIDIEKLKAVMDGSADLSEEELGTIASILDIEKFDDEKEEKEKPEAEEAPAAAPEAEAATEPEEEKQDMEPGETGMKVLHEKLNALAALTSEIASMMSEMDMLQEKADGDEEKSEDGSGTASGTGEEAQQSEHLNPEVTKTIIGQLTGVLNEIKDALVTKSADDAVGEVAGKKPEDDPAGDDSPDVVEMQKKLDDMQKKLDGFERAGVTKSLSEDDSATEVKKEAPPSWSFFGPDFK